MAPHTRLAPRVALAFVVLTVGQGFAPGLAPPVEDAGTARPMDDGRLASPVEHPGFAPLEAPVGSSAGAHAPVASRPVDPLARLELRMASVERQGRELRLLHERRVAPLIALLELRTSASPESIERTALALVREGVASGVDPRLLAAVLLVENPWLDPMARSPVGAVGLMQVMPFHAGQWGCPGDDLEHPETNICHGAKILAEAIRRARDLDTALLRYNGCRYGTNTPDCHRYPQWVSLRAGPHWMAEIDAALYGAEAPTG